MKTKLLTVMLLAGGALFAAPRISIGIGVGAPRYYAPAPVVAVRPPCPGPGYSWVDGYWTPGRTWVAGYWAAPYRGAYVAAPHYAYRGRDWDRGRGWEHRR